MIQKNQHGDHKDIPRPRSLKGIEFRTFNPEIRVRFPAGLYTIFPMPVAQWNEHSHWKVAGSIPAGHRYNYPR